MTQKYHVGAYYFPNYHFDPQNEALHGKGWNEWRVLQYATPRFPGHQQPKVPVWGYEDESDPAVMEKKINAAADHGVDTFLFDWYYFDNGPFLERCLEQGFLKADNVDRMNFALMWANHDWTNMHPKGLVNAGEVQQRGDITKETFVKATDHMIKHYFSHPSYLRMEGGLYLTFYELANLLSIFGGVEETRKGLEEFRERVRAAGLGELHLNAVAWSNSVLPAEQSLDDFEGTIHSLGFDSVTSYVWVHMREMDSFPTKDYGEYQQECMAELETIAADYNIPYYPNVTVGWDPSPRTIQSDFYEDVGYPFTPILTENTPEEFEKALRKAKQYVDKNNIPPLITINAWNEWTEGSYLEPDTEHGMGYLEAIKRVFIEK